MAAVGNVDSKIPPVGSSIASVSRSVVLKYQFVKPLPPLESDPTFWGRIPQRNDQILLSLDSSRANSNANKDSFLRGTIGSVLSGYALHSRLPHILWSADPPAAYVLDHL